jgi:hypothetical protein
MTPEEKQRAIAAALKILKPAPELREACRQEIEYEFDQLDQVPNREHYERMLRCGEFLSRAARINRTLPDDMQSPLDEVVDSNKKLRALHKKLTLSPDKWRKKQAVIAAYSLLQRWKHRRDRHGCHAQGAPISSSAFAARATSMLRVFVELAALDSPRGDWMRPSYIERLSSTKGKDWYRLSSILYGKPTKHGKPADLRRQMRRILPQPGWVATSSVVSCHVPVRTVSVWSVSKRRLTLFVDGRKPRY